MLSWILRVFIPFLLRLLIIHFTCMYLRTLRSLNAIPNAHPTAPFSSLWLLSIRYRGRENRTVWESHKRLGPIVRLAPEEVSVCTLQGLKTIYGDWEKNAWYEAFSNHGLVSWDFYRINEDQYGQMVTVAYTGLCIACILSSHFS